MTSDITKLAQRVERIISDMKLKHGGNDTYAPIMKWDEFSALVEALEKAQRANAAQDDHINQQQDRIDQLEKGHQEAAKQINSWRRMAKQNIAEREKDIAELDAARQRIAELESRTVKLPDLRQIVSGDRYVWSDGVYNYSQDVKVALADAGIKVEAE